ncbi:MAG: nuclear transport factor 2 family protein [Phenylobacterium sp.]
MDDNTLKAARDKTIRDHMRLEVEGDFEAVLKTFEHPRYELYGQGTVFDGRDAVMSYFARSRTPFPDQGNELITLRHADDAVVIEMWLTGTHQGPLQIGDKVHPPTGRAFKIRMAAVFEFAPGSDKIICERPYFDPTAIWAQLGLT